MGVNIDWSLAAPQPAPNFVGDYLQGQQEGVLLHQQQAVRSALAASGGDPVAGMKAALAAGDVQTASALQGYSRTGAQLGALSQGVAGLFRPKSALSQASSAAPATPVAPAASLSPATPPPSPASAPATALAPPAVPPALGQPTPPATPASAAMHGASAPASAAPGNLFEALSRPSDAHGAFAGSNPSPQARIMSDLDNLSALPYAQRQPALQAVKSDYAAIGMPAQNIDQFDPTDGNLAILRANLISHSQAVGAPMAGQPTPVGPASSAAPQAPAPQAVVSAGAPPAPAAPNAAPQTGSQAGGFLDIQDPDVQRSLTSMALGGVNIAPLVDMGKTNMPDYEAGRPGSYIINKKTGAVGSQLPNVGEGMQVLWDAQGNPHAVPLPGYAQNKEDVAEATATGTGIGDAKTAGPIAYAKTHGGAAASADFEMLQVPMADGSYRTMPKSTYLAMVASGQAPPGLGVTPGIADTAFQHQDADNFSKTVATVGDPLHVQGLQQQAAQAQQGLKLAQGLNPGAFFGAKADVAKVLSGLGVPGASDLANNATTYNQLTSQSVLNYTKQFGPRGATNRDVGIINAIRPSLTTPKDAASLYFGTQAALANQQAQYSNFVQNWQGPKSQQAVAAAWANGPGRASIFADPVFQNLTINGKPAVQVAPHPIKGPDGQVHTWGILRPGTPYAQQFLVQ